MGRGRRKKAGLPCPSTPMRELVYNDMTGEFSYEEPYERQGQDRPRNPLTKGKPFHA